MGNLKNIKLSGFTWNKQDFCSLFGGTLCLGTSIDCMALLWLSNYFEWTFEILVNIEGELKSAPLLNNSLNTDDSILQQSKLDIELRRCLVGGVFIIPVEAVALPPSNTAILSYQSVNPF